MNNITRPSASRADFGNERGSSTIGVIMFFPLVLMLLFLTVLTGRMVNTQQEVISAARDGARAASVVGSEAAAVAAATAAVQDTMVGAGVACQNLNITVATGSFGAGGHVTVTVRCDVSIADVTSSWVPGTKEFEAVSTTVMDVYRGGDQ